MNTQVWLSSDTGRSPSLLAQEFNEFPQLLFEGLPDVWWFTGGSTDPAVVHLEPEGEFYN